MCRQAGDESTKLREIAISPNDPGLIATGQVHVFPANIVQQLAIDLGRGVDCYFPTMEAEAAVASFVLALQAAGWRVFQPCGDPQN